MYDAFARVYGEVRPLLCPRFVLERPRRTMLAPRRAREEAIASPIPLDAPDTTAVRPSINILHVRSLGVLQVQGKSCMAFHDETIVS